MPTKRFDIVESPVAFDLRGIFGFGANDIWVVGEMSTVLHWDGTGWTKLATPFRRRGEEAERRGGLGKLTRRRVDRRARDLMLHYRENAR